MYIDQLDDIVNEYNNTYHRTIKMKPVDVKNNTYIDSNKDVHDKDPKFKVGDHVRLSKYKNIFTIGYTPNWSEEVFVIKYMLSLFNEVTGRSYSYRTPLLAASVIENSLLITETLSVNLRENF